LELDGCSSHPCIFAPSVRQCSQFSAKSAQCVRAWAPIPPHARALSPSRTQGGSVWLARLGGSHARVLSPPRTQGGSVWLVSELGGSHARVLSSPRTQGGRVWLVVKAGWLKLWLVEVLVG
jgi:hypothetical protein